MTCSDDAASTQATDCKPRPASFRAAARRPSFRFSDLWRAPLHDFPIRDEVLYQYLPLSSEMEVLEIGPGSGFTAFRLSRQVRHLTAVEISAEPVQQLRASLKEIRNLKLVCADVCAPDLHRVVDRRFDAAFGLEVFEYLRDPRACLKNLAAVLRPGASLLLEFPNYPPPRSPGITYFRSRQEFDPLMYAAGFARWELYALRLRRHARVLFRAFHERPLQWFRALHERNGRPKPMTYDQTWAFQNRRRFEAHMPLLHAAWALLSAAMHCGGDCFERMELGSDLLNHDLLVLARR